MFAAKRCTALSSLARNYATRPLRQNASADETRQQREHDEEMRRMRTQERLEQAKLLADIDMLCERLEPFNHSALQTIRSTTTSLSGVLLKHYTETKQIIDDISREPYPEWTPGTPDVVTRRVADPKTNRKQVEIEAGVRRREAQDALDSIDAIHKDMAEVKSVWTARGKVAGISRANRLAARRRQGPSPVVRVPLEPVDLDTIPDTTWP